MRILVLDDDRLLALILSDHLAERGHRVVPAYDGKRALVFCEEKPFDMVVIDLVLPELNGMEFLEKLRETHPKVRAVMITGFPDLLEEKSEHLAALGVEAIIEKPFSFSDVDSVVEAPA